MKIKITEYKFGDIRTSLRNSYILIVDREYNLFLTPHTDHRKIALQTMSGGGWLVKHGFMQGGVKNICR